MSTFLLIHGGGDVGWYWHLLGKELRARGHEAVAPDLPDGDDSLTLDDYADHAVEAVEAVAADRDLVVVGHSFGAYTASLVAARRPVASLVLVAGMVPAPGESPEAWWGATGHAQAVRRQAARDGGLTGNEDPYTAFYHDVPPELATDAMSRERAHPSPTAWAQPWPLDAWPAVPTRFVLCTEDRVFPPDFLRRLVRDRLALVPEEIAAGHCVALSRPAALADLLTDAPCRPAAP
ncbi:alpha/beta hydrolase [Streptomyces sp. WAC07061]|uniref:alpha/beta fold hydrolase n=1 Tax=Streptomyces sp. WAC07061 TaxID=2487410 RepID=UPI000F774052|nr:alpha/beta hydrolase [Streptomyces sp. WAC07061]RSS50363.1 alpha/beta hydrolase [Streptomyces sp. WAC07061]